MIDWYYKRNQNPNRSRCFYENKEVNVDKVTVMFHERLFYPYQDSCTEYKEPVVILGQSVLGKDWWLVEGKILGKCNVHTSLLEHFDDKKP